MPRVSVQRKALIALNTRKAHKRVKLREGRTRLAEAEPLPGSSQVSPSASDSPSSPPSNIHVSAASYRHSLLPDELRETSSVNSTAFICMSLKRLEAILKFVSCPDCGKKLQNNITMQYFDCTVTMRCDECAKLVHHSEPNRCKNGDFGKGNIMYVYHSLCEGYGRAGLSRLSAAMGTKEMSTTTYTERADYVYKQMNSYYDEQQLVTKRCVENIYQKDGIEKDSDGILNINVSFNGTWLTKGHKSHIGATFVMEINSGMAIDYEILINFCISCAIMKKKKDKNSFEQWKISEHAGKCQKKI